MTRAAFVRAIEEIFGVEARTLHERSSRETIPEWTSLADVQIFTLIQTEFGVEPDQVLIEADTIGELTAALREKGAFS